MPKCKVKGYMRFSKYQNIFSKGYEPDWKKIEINKVENTAP